jgi:hypothetical protein
MPPTFRLNRIQRSLLLSPLPNQMPASFLLPPIRCRHLGTYTIKIYFCNICRQQPNINLPFLYRALFYSLCKFPLTCVIESFVSWANIRHRGLQRDVVYVTLLTNSAPHIRVQMRGEGGVAGSQPMSTAVHIT